MSQVLANLARQHEKVSQEIAELRGKQRSLEFSTIDYLVKNNMVHCLQIKWPQVKREANNYHGPIDLDNELSDRDMDAMHDVLDSR